MTTKVKRSGAVASLTLFAALIAISLAFHRQISASDALTNTVLAFVALSILASGYFVPRAIGTLRSKALRASRRK